MWAKKNPLLRQMADMQPTATDMRIFGQIADIHASFASIDEVQAFLTQFDTRKPLESIICIRGFFIGIAPLSLENLFRYHSVFRDNVLMLEIVHDALVAAGLFGEVAGICFEYFRYDLYEDLANVNEYNNVFQQACEKRNEAIERSLSKQWTYESFLRKYFLCESFFDAEVCIVLRHFCLHHGVIALVWYITVVLDQCLTTPLTPHYWCLLMTFFGRINVMLEELNLVSSRCYQKSCHCQETRGTRGRELKRKRARRLLSTIL